MNRFCRYKLIFLVLLGSLDQKFNLFCVADPVDGFNPVTLTESNFELQNLQQGSKACTEYLNMAKECANELSAVGKLIEDDDLISFVVSGLNPLFNTFVTIHSFATCDNEMSFADFQFELLSHEIMLENQQHKTFTPKIGSFALHTNKQRPSNFNHQNSINFKKTRFPPRINPRSQHFAAKNSTGYLLRGNNGYPSSNQPGFIRNSSQGNSSHPSNNDQALQPPCQICGKSGHSALDCYHMMDYAY
jgi:hypothetical protein